MDPHEAWSQLRQAIAKEEWEEAAEIAANLLEWLDKDGMPPVIIGHRLFDQICARGACEIIQAWDFVPMGQAAERRSA